MLDKKQLEAQQRLECYQARLSKAFNKRIRPRYFHVRDLVLVVCRPIIVICCSFKQIYIKMRWTLYGARSLH